MKGVLNPDHIGLNNYQLIVLGDVPPLTPVAIGELEDELEVAELPDRTIASGGSRLPTEFDLTLAAHHTLEIAGMEKWFIEAQGPVAPTYKKDCTLILKKVGGDIGRVYNLHGVFPKKRVTPALEMENVGELANIVYTMSVDDVLPVT
jgi:hypothetical protein